VTIQEALKRAEASDGSLWARPVGWRGVAYVVHHGTTHIVPGVCGGMVCMTVEVKYLIGEWEVITPEQVISENKHTGDVA
jgi:hypothetical protein